MELELELALELELELELKLQSSLRMVCGLQSHLVSALGCCNVSQLLGEVFGAHCRLAKCLKV
uniref:Uncharacterized protein n=1 Tax=Drosophila arizonae TaxID=7263 RepID=A0A0B4UC72_DROAR|nr:hypothetical protein [Drosophila arizonae]